MTDVKRLENFAQGLARVRDSSGTDRREVRADSPTLPWLGLR